MREFSEGYIWWVLLGSCSRPNERFNPCRRSKGTWAKSNQPTWHG